MRRGKTSPALSSDYLLIYDLATGHPVQLQALPLHATFQGLSWAPSSDALYTSGGVDDLVREFVRKNDQFLPGRTFRMGHKSWIGPPIALWDGPDGSHCTGCTGEVAALAVSPDGRGLLTANMLNDSVSLIDLQSGEIKLERDLRPGLNNPKLSGHAGGSYPRALVWTSTHEAFVASERDREIICLAVEPHALRIAYRIPVHGQPVALAANRLGNRVYVALDTTNKVAIIDTVRHKLIEQFDVAAPAAIYSNHQQLGGANTTLSRSLPTAASCW